MENPPEFDIRRAVYSGFLSHVGFDDLVDPVCDADEVFFGVALGGHGGASDPDAAGLFRASRLVRDAVLVECDLVLDQKILDFLAGKVRMGL